MFFEKIALKGTTVLVFEDLQWADSGLLDFIDHLIDWSRGLPILVLTLARPELLDRRPAWGAGRRHFPALDLDPMADGEVRVVAVGSGNVKSKSRFAGSFLDDKKPSCILKGRLLRRRGAPCFVYGNFKSEKVDVGIYLC